MNRSLTFLLCTLICLLLPSCSLGQKYWSQKNASASGLYDVQLEHSYKVAVDGLWLAGKGNPYARQKEVNFYVAPLNIDKVRDVDSEFTPTMVEQMDALMTQELTKAFAEANAANGTQWQVTRSPQQADIRFDLAVVSLKKQKPGMNLASKVLGYVAPTGVGDAAAFIAAGDITLEGTIRDNRRGTLLMAFKDANRATLRLYDKETYSRTGNVDANLQIWAEKLAKLCREAAHDRLGDDTLKHRIEERSTGDIIKTRVHDSL